MEEASAGRSCTLTRELCTIVSGRIHWLSDCPSWILQNPRSSKRFSTCQATMEPNQGSRLFSQTLLLVADFGSEKDHILNDMFAWPPIHRCESRASFCSADRHMLINHLFSTHTILSTGCSLIKRKTSGAWYNQMRNILQASVQWQSGKAKYWSSWNFSKRTSMLGKALMCLKPEEDAAERWG